MPQPPLISIVVPVFDGGEPFKRCLDSVRNSSFKEWELIVVDDGSRDGSHTVAEAHGALLLRTSGRKGPGHARNLGAERAQGEYVLFLDADCELHSATLEKFAQAVKADPSTAAFFGSYDDAPASEGFVGQYKNLFHHYIHQRARREASTFWSGCGLIRRSVFNASNGFDERRYPRPSIEDIELGYRLRAAGYAIRTLPEAQVKHLKSWTLPGLLRSDVLDRGIPWAELILERGTLVDDLNLMRTHRWSAVIACLMVTGLVAASVWPLFLLSAIGLAVLLLFINRDLYLFYLSRRGVWFALRSIPLHWLYYLYSIFAFAAGAVRHAGSRVEQRHR